MDRIKTDMPNLTDASVKKATGKTMKEWVAALDKFGGVDKGRREVVNHLYAELNKDIWWASTLGVEYEKAKGLKEKDGRAKGYGICVTKTIKAPVAKVFAAWKDPKQLNQWMGSKFKQEFKDGGTFSNGDGDKGQYKRIRENKDLRFTWDAEDLAPDTLVDVTFAAKGDDKCLVTLNHTRIQDRTEADMLRDGWGACFEKLKAMLE